jgi:hypothetical protein
VELAPENGPSDERRRLITIGLRPSPDGYPQNDADGDRADEAAFDEGSDERRQIRHDVADERKR